MQAINFALEDALRSRVREYPEKALRWVESLHAGNGGADALDLLRMKGRDVFCIWYLEKAWKRLPRGLDTDAVEDGALSHFSALLDDGVGFRTEPSYPPRVFFAVLGEIVSTGWNSFHRPEKFLTEAFADVLAATIKTASAVLPRTQDPGLSHDQLDSIALFQGHQYGRAIYYDDDDDDDPVFRSDLDSLSLASLEVSSLKRPALDSNTKGRRAEKRHRHA
ncbi:hypothetical protein B0H13DRAFT_2369381 [Mycena leptocephala]|nr:hypothetical protein B0H13DRAFT_2369381 [Mycena leptocephala]